jgi:hypothetical protein
MVMAVHTSSMRVELLLVVLTGAFGLVTGVSVVVRNSRAEHRRWLRQERLKAYSAYHGIANGGLEAINAMLVAFLHTGQANPQAIVRRAEQTSADLNRPAGSILLLGPEHVSTAAGAVRFSLGWSAKVPLEAMAELDDDGRFRDKPSAEPSDAELPKLEADGHNLFQRTQEVSDALADFNRLAADEIQGRRVRGLLAHYRAGRRWPWRLLPTPRAGWWVRSRARIGLQRSGARRHMSEGR